MGGIRHYKAELSPLSVRELIDSGEQTISLAAEPDEYDTAGQPTSSGADKREVTIDIIRIWKLAEGAIRANGLTPDGGGVNVIIPANDKELVTLEIVDTTPPPLHSEVSS